MQAWAERVARGVSAPGGDAVPRAAFVCTAILGGALFWVAHRPPMGDLPQHAGQVALLHDLLEGTSPWSDLVRINWFTPYLLGCSIAAALSFVLPVIAALKVAMTAAYYAFVAASVALRRELGGDARLDWLFLPGCFGFAFRYGFYTFLVAAPVGLLFVLAARRYATRPTRAAAIRLVLMGVALFFCHGLVFLFAVAVGAGMAVVDLRPSAPARALLPYGVLGLVALAFYVHAKLRDPLLAHGHTPMALEWGRRRLVAFAIYVVASTAQDWVFLPAVCLMLAAPWLLGARPSRDRAALVPLAAVLFIWVLAPGVAMETSYLYHRFALYLLPAYVFALSPARPVGRARSLGVQAALALLCWSFFGSVALRSRRFQQESAPFEDVLAATEPGQRAMGLVFDPYSPASGHPWAYHAYPLWYQVDRHGFVDFNFAYFLPEMVRFQPDRTPPIEPVVMHPETFRWHDLDAADYRYFFVRHTKPIPPGLFQNDQCRVALLRSSGEWAVYERRECRAP